MKRFFQPCLSGLVAASLCLGVVAPHGASALIASTPLRSAYATPSFYYDKGKQGAFTTASLQDSAGRIWIATEDNGVWMRNTMGSWQQFTLNNSTIGDDTFYALAEDRQGRIWAGTLRNGVSVFDGKKWQNYGLNEGLLGERIFDIAVCPTDGDVWIATSLGLMRYRAKQDSWVSNTRANGLPSDQVQALAFDSNGTLYVATQCDGLAISDAKSNFSTWRRVTGPMYPDILPFAKDVKAPQGLPSNLLNDVFVAKSGVVYVATTCGLAKSDDGGATWSYARGRDWGDKVRGRWRGLPWARWTAKPGATLSEDYVTALAEDASGNLWIGHRATGYEVFDPKTNERVYGAEKDTLSSRSAGRDSLEYVTSLLPTSDGSMMAGFYGGGIAPSDFHKGAAKKGSVDAATVIKVASSVKLPSPAALLTLTEIEAQLINVRKLKAQMPVGSGVYESEDWRTQGDWLGRYGRQYTVLCAARAPLDHYIYKDNNYEVRGEIGPHRQGKVKDSLRYYVHWENAGNNLRVLYNPITGYRREAEWDDHAETYPNDFEGPDLWVRVTVPEGVHRMSCYFYNKDGHDTLNRRRDYLVELKPDAPTTSKAQKLPNLATTRVRDFWGGVYKSFIVRGPAKYWVRVGKNNSHNTILQSVMIDKVVGPQTPFDTQSLSWMGHFRYEMPDPFAPSTANGLTSVAVLSSKKGAASKGVVSNTRSDVGSAQATLLLYKARLWEFWLDGAYGVNGGALRSQKLRLMILRNLSEPKSDASPELLARWRWKARVWNEDDRKSWKAAMIEGREAMLTLNPRVRGKEF